MNNTSDVWLNIEEVCSLTNSKKETIRRKCKSGEYKCRFELAGRNKNYQILLSSMPLKYIEKYKSYLTPTSQNEVEQSLEAYSNAPKWMKAKDNFNKGTEAADEFRIPDYNITGVFLQPNSVANKSINAGLPNITGYISGDDYKMASIGGAFYYSGTASGQHCETVGGSFNIIQFNASRISTIYGKSATVQPPSKTVQICIRYK